MILYILLLLHIFSYRQHIENLKSILIRRDIGAPRRISIEGVIGSQGTPNHYFLFYHICVIWCTVQHTIPTPSNEKCQLKTAVHKFFRQPTRKQIRRAKILLGLANISWCGHHRESEEWSLERNKSFEQQFFF